MEILAHAAIGCATGSALGCGTDTVPSRAAVLAAGFIGGVFPDIDALSLAPGFDGSVGAFLHLTHLGREIFFGSFPYSHRMAMHSLSVPFAVIIITYLILRLRKMLKPESQSAGTAFRVAAAFALAYVFHLFCDMVTPAGTWGGIRLFFPADTTFGGWGLRWWWNNYDVTLAGLSVAAGAGLLSFFTSIPGKIRSITAITMLLTGIIICAMHVSQGSENYNSRGMTYQKKNERSFQHQKKIVGTGLAGIMRGLTSGMLH